MWSYGIAFVAQHSLFPVVAKDRPNTKDIEIAIDFSKKCNDIICSLSSTAKDIISVKGSKEYRKGGAIFFPQKVSDRCTKCGICASICPVNAIDPKSLQKIDKGICLSCAGCITYCPQNSRSFTGLSYKIKGKIFSSIFSKYKNPELFYVIE